MFTARQIKSCQPLLLLAVLEVTAGPVDRSVCLAQTVSASARSIPPRARQTEQFVADGVAAFERGDTAWARDSFQKALGLNPDEVTAHTYLGIISDGAGDLKEAERHFSAAALAEPLRASARNNYGAILMRTGRLRLAAEQFEASLKLDRNQPNALVNLAQIRFAAGTSDDLRASAELFTRAHAIKPDVEIARALTVISLRLQNYPAALGYHHDYAARLAVESGTSAHAAAARAELGGALFEAGLLKEAEAELTAAINLNSADADAARIETHLRRAAELDPTFTPARLSLGKLSMRAQRWTDAAAEFEQVIKLDPNVAEAYYQLGRALNRLKRTAEAQTALATFKRLSDSQKQQEQDEQGEIVRRLADVIF